MHLTLVFLAWQPCAILAAVQEATARAAAAVRPFDLALGRLGHFGGAAPRVLWVAAQDRDGQLARLTPP